MQDILITREDHILRIQLNRPQKKNALTPAMYDTLRQAIESADNENDIRVIYITGSGDSFTAGNDLNSFLQEPGSVAPAQFIKAIASAQTPIVAAVNGVAVGVGVTLLLHCDLVYAADSATLRLPFIDLGLVPEAASTYLLPRMAGYGRAAELLLLGEAFSAEKAWECGIVNAVVAAMRWMNWLGRKRSSWRPSLPRRCARPRSCSSAGPKRRYRRQLTPSWKSSPSVWFRTRCVASWKRFLLGSANRR